jgi:hypothetical protein
VLLIAGGVVLLVAVANVAMAARTERLLRTAFAEGHSCCGPLEIESKKVRLLIDDLGGRKMASWRLRLHLALPNCLTSKEARAAAVCLLDDWGWMID